jgi:hypothetical protein
MAKQTGKIRRKIPKAKGKVRKAKNSRKLMKSKTLNKLRQMSRVLQKRKNTKARGIRKRLTKSEKKAA